MSTCHPEGHAPANTGARDYNAWPLMFAGPLMAAALPEPVWAAWRRRPANDSSPER